MNRLGWLKDFHTHVSLEEYLDARRKADEEW